MFKVALKSLFAHKLRLALTAFSIIISVAFVSGTYVFTDSIGSTFNTLFDDIYSGTDVSVRRAQGDFFESDTTFEESVLETVRQIEGVEVAEPEVSGVAAVLGSDGDVVGAQGPPKLGFSWTENASLNTLVIKEGNGRAPEAAGEVVVDANTATLGELNVGDIVEIQTVGPLEGFELVGIASFGDADSIGGATLAAFEFREAQRLFDQEGELTAVNIQAKEGVSADDLRDRIAESVGEELEAVTGDQQAQESQTEINSALGFISTALLAFAGVSIFVGSFIIQNTFRIIISQRSKELALLRAVGATKKQVMVMVLTEALVVAIVASTIGLLLGQPVSEMIRGLANAGGLGLPDSTFTMLPRTVIVSMSVGVIVTLGSALMPAFKASKVTPIEALRANEASRKGRSLKLRGALSMTSLVVGIAFLLYGLNASVASPIVYVGIGVFIMFLAVAALAPILSRPLADIIGWPFKKIKGMPGMLAQENTKRTPRRTASTAAALMIGVSLVTFVSIFAASVKLTVDDVVTKSFGSDLSIYSPSFEDGVSKGVYEGVSELDVISLSSRSYYAQVKIDDQENYVMAVEPETFGSFLFISPESGGYENLTLNTVYVRETHLAELGLKVGDTIQMSAAEGQSQSLEIADTFGDDYDTKFIISYETYDAAVDAEYNDTILYLNYAEGVIEDEGREIVDEYMESYPLLLVQSLSELTNQAKQQIDQLLTMFWGLLGLAILIAVLGIANTLALSVSERTRELGLLRAVGMSKRQVRVMVRVESVIISLFGALLGVIMGIFFAWVTLKALESEGLTSFAIPPIQIAILFALAAFAGVLASIFPAFRASRVSVLDAINFE